METWRNPHAQKFYIDITFSANIILYTLSFINLDKAKLFETDNINVNLCLIKYEVIIISNNLFNIIFLVHYNYII